MKVKKLKATALIMILGLVVASCGEGETAKPIEDSSSNTNHYNPSSDNFGDNNNNNNDHTSGNEQDQQSTNNGNDSGNSNTGSSGGTTQDPDTQSSRDMAINLSEFRDLVANNKFANRNTHTQFGFVANNGHLTNPNAKATFTYHRHRRSGFTFCSSSSCRFTRVIENENRVNNTDFEVDRTFNRLRLSLTSRRQDSGLTLEYRMSRILNVVDNAVQSAPCHGMPGVFTRCYDVRTSNGFTYRIDLDYPLMANPTIIDDGERYRYSLFNWTVR